MFDFITVKSELLASLHYLKKHPNTRIPKKVINVFDKENNIGRNFKRFCFELGKHIHLSHSEMIRRIMVCLKYIEYASMHQGHFLSNLFLKGSIAFVIGLDDALARIILVNKSKNIFYYTIDSSKKSIRSANYLMHKGVKINRCRAHELLTCLQSCDFVLAKGQDLGITGIFLSKGSMGAVMSAGRADIPVYATAYILSYPNSVASYTKKGINSANELIHYNHITKLVTDVGVFSPTILSKKAVKIHPWI